MSFAHCKAIDLIASGDIDHKAIVVALAKVMPEALVELHEFSVGKTRNGSASCKEYDEFLNAVCREYRGDMPVLNPGGDKVRAIKYWRSVTGDDLKTSKDAVDTLIVRGVPPMPACFARNEPDAVGASEFEVRASIISKLNVNVGRTEDDERGRW